MPRQIGLAMATATRPTVTGNSFLDSLSLPARERIAPLLEPLTLRKGDGIDRQGERIARVVFPLRCVISTLTEFTDGNAVEVGFAGHEGMTGLPLAYGDAYCTNATLVQISGSALGIDAPAFAAHLHDDADLRRRARAYANYSYVACTQFAACNRLHPITERYARWLLMAHDRVGSSEFVLTQEYCAQILGVRRASVTLVAGEFAAARFIEYKRGHLTVLDRAGLETAACECYGRVNGELQRLMGYGARHVAL
jgi:CRP-like cAMP-binding protein